MRNKYGELRIVQLDNVVSSSSEIGDILTSEQLKQLSDFIAKNIIYYNSQLILQKELTFVIKSGDTDRIHVLRFNGVLDDNETLIFADVPFIDGNAIENIMLHINVGDISGGIFYYKYVELGGE